MTELVLQVPKELRRGARRQSDDKSIRSALDILGLVCRSFAIDDLGNSSVLDVGCGCKLVQAMLEYDLPVGRYEGVDVFPDLINFLQENVKDPRFNFHVLNAHNEMYNPDGAPLTGHTHLPLEKEAFDIICLFSVFTHLAPHDYVSMLKMLRPYIKPGGKILFSLFLQEETESGNAFWDSVVRGWAKNQDKLEERREDFEEAIKQERPDFVDYDPGQPLKWAMYSRKHALELVEGTGWKVESLNDPQEYIQHYMICTPE